MLGNSPLVVVPLHINSFDVLGDDVSLLPVSNAGIAESHAVNLGLTKDGMPCH